MTRTTKTQTENNDDQPQIPVRLGKNIDGFIQGRKLHLVLDLDADVGTSAMKVGANGKQSGGNTLWCNSSGFVVVPGEDLKINISGIVIK